jgi:endopolyphosphatase
MARFHTRGAKTSVPTRRVVFGRGDSREAVGHKLEHHVCGKINRHSKGLTDICRYFFTSNSAVDGCAKKREPGYEHMEWLRIQLQILRERGMKAILIGHVPPARVDSKESWDETCWQKYTLFGRQFRDVIVGSLYGHMNIDHFMLQDFEHIEKDTENGKMGAFESRSALANEVALLEDGEVTVASAADYLLNLRETWAQLPAPPPKSNKKSHSKSFDEEEEEDSIWDWLMFKISKSSKDRKEERKRYLKAIGGRYAERYAVSHVSPSVVPNYFPTLRIIEYNITGLEHLSVASRPISPPMIDTASEQLPISASDDDDDDDNDAEEEHPQDVDTSRKKKHKGKKDKKKPRKYKFKVPDGPSKSSPPGPAYSPQTLTWTRHIQYFANLTHINNDFLEPPPDAAETPIVSRSRSTNPVSVSTIFGFGVSADGTIESKKWNEGKHKKHQGKRPRPEPHPNPFVFEVEYDTKKDRGFNDLTVRRWVEYARKIGAKKGESKEVGVEEEEEEEEDKEGVEEDESCEDCEEENQGFDEQDYVAAKGKKHKHKKGKHHKKHKASKEWFTFVKRAFVGTMDARDIKLVFGAAGEVDADALQDAKEVMEL